jgi:glycosyltransferase involved in cell wall biosynthesis
MNILYLTFDDLTAPYAWTVHVRSIINRLVRSGHRVRLVAPGGQAPGIDAPCDPLPPGRLHHLMGSLKTFVRSGQDARADVVYVRGIHATVTPALAAERLQRPIVVEINGLLEREAKSRWRRAAVRVSHRFTLARAARVVTVAPRLKDAISSRYGFPADRIDVVPNGADASLFRPLDRDDARRRLGLPLDRPIVLCVASFYAHHSRELLVDAARRAGALLVLVGGKAERSQDLIAVGPLPHDRVPDYVAAADVCAYVLRSPYESAAFSPLKVYEYMAAGRPVVAATDLEDLRDFVNRNGIGVAVGLDGEALAMALKDLLPDVEVRERMGHRGRDLAETTYTWDRAATGVENALRAALSAK